MNEVILSTAYLPPVGYFCDLCRAPVVYIEKWESYTRQSSRNRCRIYGPNGIQRLSIPVIHPSRDNRAILGVRIDDTTNWRSVHWRSIEAAYNKSPYFLYYRDGFEKLIFSKETSLFYFNHALLLHCLDCLKCDTVPAFTETYRKAIPGVFDLRETRSGKGKPAQRSFPRYTQVFGPAHGFIPDLSIVDLLFNRGNEARGYLLAM